MTQKDMIDCKTSVETQYVRKFDSIARLHGYSRRKLMKKIMTWIALGTIDISQLIRLEQEQQ